ncbi:MgtC/SapB family protein [Bacillus sp. Marseille-P3661]|uniref:MgtC/SapB family protein n=1 Tax=Bacillus sp. Marseille-P3661 TaxID=1936234 RepID=UPI000C839241|nr:MgtC/SapB family protein [Bacillus sp. Marseille-P3661]
MVVSLGLLLKLGLSTIIGVIIGLERELKNKPLGLKTSIVIAVSSCLLTIVSIEAAYTFKKESGVMMDPMRLAAQIISGVGFIGAGTILVQGLSVRGLTTAAMIWGAAGLGIATGAGFYKEAILSLILIIVSVELLPLLIKLIGPRRLNEKSIRIKMTIKKERNMTEIFKDIKAIEVAVDHVKVDDLENKETVILELLVRVNKKRYTTDVHMDLKAIDGVLGVKCETI